MDPCVLAGERRLEDADRTDPLGRAGVVGLQCRDAHDALPLGREPCEHLPVLARPHDLVEPRSDEPNPCAEYRPARLLSVNSTTPRRPAAIVRLLSVSFEQT